AHRVGHHPRSTPFPYTTLFRSRPGGDGALHAGLQRGERAGELRGRHPTPAGDGDELPAHGADERDDVRVPGVRDGRGGERLERGDGERDATGGGQHGAHGHGDDQQRGGGDGRDGGDADPVGQ